MLISKTTQLGNERKLSHSHNKHDLKKPLTIKYTKISRRSKDISRKSLRNKEDSTDADIDIVS